MGGKVPIHVTLDQNDMTELDTLARVYDGNRSLALRLIIDFWRNNRNPGNSEQMVRLKALAEGHMRDQIMDDEFITEAKLLILTYA